MDGLSLFKIKNYINKHYIPCELNAVYQTDGGILLDIYKDKKETILFDVKNNIVLFNPDVSKLSKLSFFNKKQAILEVSQRGYDRILELKIASRKQSGKIEYFYLIAEFIGGNSNFFILNENRKIIFKLSENNVDKDRDISIGATYQYFKRNKIFTLDTVKPEKLKTFNDLEGFYPATSRFADILFEKKGYEHTIKIIKDYLSNEHLYIDNKRKFYPFMIKDTLQEIKISSLTPKNEYKNEENTLKNKLLSLIAKKITKEEVLLKKLKGELLKASEYDKFRLEAEILKSNYHLIKDRKGVITVNHYTEDGIADITIDTDKIGNIDQAIQKLFERYKKLKRSITPLENRILEIESNILSLREEEFNIENATSQELALIYQSYFNQKKEVRKKEIVERIKKLIYKGYEILIGKNSKSNHELVFHIASNTDIWMHAQKIPSAHIIIRNNTVSEIPEDVLFFAGRITAYFSKAKNDKKVNIDYTLKKYVKKPPKTKEGFVIYSNFKTITVEPLTEKEALELSLI
jgi:predicted ribosome quality control (RQC) complex YloA/Tae2 family protein